MQLWTAPSHAALTVKSQKLERLIKGGRASLMQLQGQAPAAHTQRVTRGVQGQENPNEEYANWNLTVFFCFPQSKIVCFKKNKSSFVLALTLKKYKLKSNKNISLVQSIWPGISRAIVTSSYHALSRAEGRVYTEAWLRSLVIAESVLGSNPLLVTILGSWEYGSYMWAFFPFVIWK